MRFIAAALLLALPFSAAAAMMLGLGGACCCKTGTGASCPMKRSASSCSAAERSTCGVARPEPIANLLPVVGRSRPATLTDVAVHAVDVRSAAAFDLPLVRFSTRARRAPDAPPPKNA